LIVFLDNKKSILYIHNIYTYNMNKPVEQDEMFPEAASSSTWEADEVSIF
jgi:hypothetical protein